MHHVDLRGARLDSRNTCAGFALGAGTACALAMRNRSTGADMNTSIGIMFALVGAALAGCSDGEGGQHEHGMDTETGMHAHAEGEHAEQVLADLPDGANQICPVMGGPVDPAIYADHDGRRIYFCCDPCVEKYKKDPARYAGKNHARASCCGN